MRGGSRQEGLGGCVVSSPVWGNEHDRPCVISVRHLRRGGTRQGVSDGCSAVRKDGDRRQLRGFGDTVRFYFVDKQYHQREGRGLYSFRPFLFGDKPFKREIVDSGATSKALHQSFTFTRQKNTTRRKR